MLEFLIKNIDKIGFIVGVLIFAVLLSTTKYWLETKWTDVWSMYLGLMAVIGSVVSWVYILRWIVK